MGIGLVHRFVLNVQFPHLVEGAAFEANLSICTHVNIFLQVCGYLVKTLCILKEVVLEPPFVDISTPRIVYFFLVVFVHQTEIYTCNA